MVWVGFFVYVFVFDVAKGWLKLFDSCRNRHVVVGLMLCYAVLLKKKKGYTFQSFLECNTCYLRKIILLIILVFHVNIAVVYLQMHLSIEESMIMLFVH